jgi:cytochrome c5
MREASGMTPKEIIGVLVAAMIGVPLFIYLIVKLFTGGINMDGSTSSMAKEAVAARLHPAGIVKVVVSAPVGSRNGQMVYEGICITCHATGLSGSPKFGDKGAWASHLSKGFDVLTQHAIKGFNAMPAKGGDPGLTDDEVKRAVAYMANSGGAKFIEPAIAADAAAKIDPAIKGKEIYDNLCTTCHAAGLNGSPKFGDKAAWNARLKGGVEAVIKAGIEGKGIMPPKGGYMGSNEEFAAAAMYMINGVK